MGAETGLVNQSKDGRVDLSVSDWENEGGAPDRLISDKTDIPVAGSDSPKKESVQTNRPVTRVTPEHHMGG